MSAPALKHEAGTVKGELRAQRFALEMAKSSDLPRSWSDALIEFVRRLKEGAASSG